MKHKLNTFHPNKVPRSDGFYGVWFVLAFLGAVFGSLLGALANPWFWFGWSPVLLGIVWLVLEVKHEAADLTRHQLKLYTAYNNLPRELRISVPKLTPQLIEGFTDFQVNKLINEIDVLQALEQDKAQALKELDPTAQHILEAMQDLKNVSREELKTIQKLRDMP